MKKGLEAPSQIMILVIFIAILAVILAIIFFFGQSLESSEAFNKTTDFGNIFKWG